MTAVTATTGRELDVPRHAGVVQQSIQDAPEHLVDVVDLQLVAAADGEQRAGVRMEGLPFAPDELGLVLGGGRGGGGGGVGGGVAGAVAVGLAPQDLVEIGQLGAFPAAGPLALAGVEYVVPGRGLGRFLGQAVGHVFSFCLVGRGDCSIVLGEWSGTTTEHG